MRDTEKKCPLTENVIGTQKNNRKIHLGIKIKRDGVGIVPFNSIE